MQEIMRIKFQEFKKLVRCYTDDWMGDRWICTQESEILGRSYYPPDYHSPGKAVYHIGATVNYKLGPISITYSGNYTCNVYDDRDDDDDYDDDDYEDHFIPMKWADDECAHGPWHSDLQIVCDNDDLACLLDDDDDEIIVSVNSGTWLADSDPCHPISREVEEYLEDYFTDLDTSDAMNEIKKIEKKEK